ncbi:MAG: hypothetical protein B7X91_09560 [Hydrogenophilales bacterium 17-64-11]|nr:MAG: hypothetical protein B7X91_09560 [Hydrogenophilales bacterium 17-64-11]
MITACSNSGEPGFMPGGTMAAPSWSSGIWNISGAATDFVMVGRNLKRWRRVSAGLHFGQV